MTNKPSLYEERVREMAYKQCEIKKRINALLNKIEEDLKEAKSLLEKYK